MYHIVSIPGSLLPSPSPLQDELGPGRSKEPESRASRVPLLVLSSSKTRV